MLESIQDRAMTRLPSSCDSRRTREGGYTLIELMVVVGIIAILSAILVRYLLNARKRSNFVAALTRQGFGSSSIRESNRSSSVT